MHGVNLIIIFKIMNCPFTAMLVCCSFTMSVKRGDRCSIKDVVHIIHDRNNFSDISDLEYSSDEEVDDPNVLTASKL